jgi:cob(I)alamin adenosyltransferase
LKSCFSLPGENPVSGLLDVARAITRKAEIHIVTLKNKNLLKNHCILVYLNRLSDLLYLLSRSFE